MVGIGVGTGVGVGETGAVGEANAEGSGEKDTIKVSSGKAVEISVFAGAEEDGDVFGEDVAFAVAVALLPGLSFVPLQPVKHVTRHTANNKSAISFFI